MADEKLSDVSVAKGVFIIIISLLLTNVVSVLIQTGINMLINKSRTPITGS